MIRQSLKMAWKSISSNKMRSFLTMLGIIIGVLSLVVLVSLVSGATDSVNDQVAGMGTNLLQVSVKDDKGKPMKLADLQTLCDEEEIEAAAPVGRTSMTASSTYSEESATVYGTSGAYERIMGLELYSGRFLKSSDMDNHTNVAVINAGLATEVMGRMNVVGESIRLDGVKYVIIGVLQAEESDTSTTQTYEAYVPYSTMVRMSSGTSSEITSFYVSASSEESLDPAEETLTAYMMGRFNQDEDAFTIINQSTIMEAMESINNTLTLLLGGIAGISLIVGGIGIMNIMLVSVTERTREIGIRKAIGAGRGTIMMQFLIEALMLSLMGCIIGIVLSWLTLKAVAVCSGGEYDYSLSVGVVWLAVSFSMFIGVAFGIYPANKAAKKKPIDALRYVG